MPAAHNSKTINDKEMKFGGVVKSHKLINLVQFNWHVLSSLRHNDVTTVEILSFDKNFANQITKVWRCF